MAKTLLLTLATASLLVCPALAAEQYSELEPNFQNGSPKNIAFFSVIGGASHYNWVLDIGNELGSRGHNFTFLTSDKDTRFAKPFSNVQAVSTGSAIEWDPATLFDEGFKKMAKENPTMFMAKIFDLMFKNFERDYLFTRQFFIDNNIDVALCDHFGDACVDAADSLKIPYIVTAAMDITKDSAAPYVNNDISTMNYPTSEFEPFKTRFMNKFVNPILGFKNVLPAIKRIQARKISVGIDAKLEDPSTRWRNAIKLSNSLFGYTPARPLGPMVELVGPIIPKKYTPLTEDLQTYLDSHGRVAYIAFGHAATPTESDIVLILTGLLESVERGSLDGFIWATVNAAGRFPDTITTQSGTVHQVKDMFDHVHPYGRMVKWAPQVAVLSHPSTTLFVSHGGLGSWYESMYTGNRMIMYPFFGDQHGNALTIETNNLGGILKPDFSVEQAVEMFHRVSADVDGEIQNNVKRMQALTQIHSRRGVSRGADIVEEVAYTNRNGRLPHRESADHRMSYFKSHNLDLYGAFGLIVALFFTVLALLIKGTVSLFKKSSQQKIKQL